MSNNNPDKPFKTYIEQIDILKNRYNLTISNDTFAEKALKSFTYYDLINGYKDCFMHNNQFDKNIIFEDICIFFIIDRGVQSILFKYSTIVENTYKSKLAYILAKNFGVFENDYLDNKHYYKTNKKTKFSDFKNHCQKIYTFSGRPIPQPTKHYKQNHNHIPPWILFKNVTFSNSLKLFRLLKQPEKQELVNLLLSTNSLNYNEKVDFIDSGLNSIREFRNVIAHNLKFITHKSKPQNKLSPATLIKIFPGSVIQWDDFTKHNRGSNDIFSYILALISFLDNELLSYSLCKDLSNYFQSVRSMNKKIYSSYMQVSNLPVDIDDRLNSYANKLCPSSHKQSLKRKSHNQKERFSLINYLLSNKKLIFSTSLISFVLGILICYILY